MKLFLLPSWVKPTAALVLCAGLLCTGWVTRGWKDSKVLMDVELRHQKQLLAQEQASRAALEKAEAARKAAQEQVNRLAALPPKVIERVRTNPSHCVLPRPVTDGLREQADETNSAIRLRRAARAAGK